MVRSFSDDNTMLCTSGFVDDVTFSHNGPYGQNQLDDIMCDTFQQVTAAAGRSVLFQITL